jgi:uncharacterized damage-inducible protein DinB
MTTFGALAGTLDRLADAVRPLTAHEYTARELRSSGSIGAHVRHCLDHVAALERGIATGQMSYDYRQRDTVVERDPRLGISRLRRARTRLAHNDDRLLERPLLLVAQIAEDGRSIRVPTTVGRELAFVISHTIHHSALVAVLLERAQRDVPDRLGLAPTTPDLACAP